MRINPISPIYRDRKREKDNDETYLKFLRAQRSAFSGRVPCIAAHYRTANNSGIGIKPLFSAIPLTHPEHAEQHRIGTFKFASRDWWEATVRIYQDRFIMAGGVIPPRYMV
jgi:hypothetical protein